MSNEQIPIRQMPEDFTPGCMAVPSPNELPPKREHSAKEITLGSVAAHLTAMSTDQKTSSS